MNAKSRLLNFLRRNKKAMGASGFLACVLLPFLCAGANAAFIDDASQSGAPAATTIQPPATASAAQTSEQKGQISGKVSELMNEKFVPAATTPNVPAAPLRPASPHVLPSSVAQAEDQTTIKNDVFRLYNEKLTPTAPAVAAPVIPAPRAVAAQSATPVAPVQPPAAIAAGAPTIAPIPAAVAPVAAPVAAPAFISTAPISTAAIKAPVAPSDLPPPPSPPLSPPSAALGLASQTPASLPVSSTMPAFPIPPAPTPNPPNSLATNSWASSSSEAPKVAAVPSPAIGLALTPNTPTVWDKNATDPAQNQPIAQNTPAMAKAAASEASAAASIGKTTGEAEGNISDIPDAAYIKALAGSDGMLDLDVSSGTSAAEADRSVPVNKPVHIDEAVAFALKNNFDVQASDEKLRGAYWDKMGAYAQYAPSAEYDWDSGGERSQPGAINDANGNRVLDSSHHRRDTNLTIRQPLIDLAVVAGILSARDKEEVVKSDQRDVREGVASDTINAFLKLVQARVAVRLADQYKSYLDNLGSRMTARVEGGGGTSADLDRIHARSELAYSARIEALGEYETDLAELRRLTKVRPSQIKIPELLAPPVPDSIDEALDRAVKANPSYQSSLGKIDIAADDRNKSYAGLLPKLSVQYNKNFSYDAGGSAEGNPVDGVYPDQKEESVLLVAQWVFGATSITSGLSGAAKEREMRLSSQDVLDRMEQAMRSSYTAINAARQRRSVLQKTVAANERVVKGFEDQYKEGTRSLFELLDSYEQLYNSKLNLMRVVIANAQASYQIRREMGELVPSILGVAKDEHG